MVKKLFVGIFILIGLIILAAVAAVLFIDVNRFKPTIETFVKDNYQRTLTIDGDLSLKLYPRIAVQLPSTKLSDPNASTNAFSIDSARVSIALMPLFSAKVQADVVKLDGLNATIVKRADGTTSIDDLIGAKTVPEKSGDSSSAQGSANLAALNIGGIELTNAKVTYQDDLAKNTVQLSNLNLVTGAIGNNVLTPVKLTVDATATNPKAKAALKIDGELQPDLTALSTKSPLITLDLKGQLDQTNLDQTVVINGLSADSKVVSAQSIKLQSRLGQQARKVLATFSSPLNYDLTAGLLTLSAFTGQLDVNDPALGNDTVTLPFKGAVTVNTNKEAVDLTLNVDAPDTALKARVNVLSFGKPEIKFDVAADRIDVDRYFPVPPEIKATDQSAAKPTAAPAPEAPIDLSALNGLNVDGKATIGKLLARGLTVSNVKVIVKAANGIATINPMQLDLYGGKMAGRTTVRAKGNRVELNADLAGVNVGPLVKDLTKDDLIEGKGDVKLNITTGGSTVTDMKKALAGSASMSLLDGAIMGINLGQKIRDAKQLLSAGASQAEASNANQKTDFAALTASFQIADGIATNTDLLGKSPLFRLDGGGKINIASGSLDYTTRASVVGTTKGQGGAERQELRGITLPVRLTGPFEAMSWKIDWREAAELALKSKLGEQLKLNEQKAKFEAQKAAKKAELEAQVASKKAELEAKKDSKVDELKDKATEKLGNKLKGLLGK